MWSTTMDRPWSVYRQCQWVRVVYQWISRVPQRHSTPYHHTPRRITPRCHIKRLPYTSPHRIWRNAPPHKMDKTHIPPCHACRTLVARSNRPHRNPMANSRTLSIRMTKSIDKAVRGHCGGASNLIWCSIAAEWWDCRQQAYIQTLYINTYRHAYVLSVSCVTFTQRVYSLLFFFFLILILFITIFIFIFWFFFL